MEITIKPMVLYFEDLGDMWRRVIKDQRGNVVYESNPEPLLSEYNSVYFDEWEKQVRSIPAFNIVNCERFK